MIRRMSGEPNERRIVAQVRCLLLARIIRPQAPHQSVLHMEGLREVDSPAFNPRDDGPDAVTVPAQRARQGVISGRVLTVLVVSLTLSIVALAIAWVIFR
jgi:hypothetical protein